MKIYLGIKYYEDNSNRITVDAISKRLGDLGHETYCIARDLEKWGRNSFSSKELMKKSFHAIDDSDALLLEFSEKGVGLGIEAGYAYSKKIPIYVIARRGAMISNTLKGIAENISYYEDFSEIKM